MCFLSEGLAHSSLQYKTLLGYYSFILHNNKICKVRPVSILIDPDRFIYIHTHTIYISCIYIDIHTHIYIVCVCMHVGCVLLCTCLSHVCHTQGGQKRASDFLELELQMDAHHLAGVGNLTWLPPEEQQMF